MKVSGMEFSDFSWNSDDLLSKFNVYEINANQLRCQDGGGGGKTWLIPVRIIGAFLFILIYYNYLPSYL